MNQLDQLITVVAEVRFDDATLRYAINEQAVASHTLAEGARPVRLEPLIEGLRA